MPKESKSAYSQYTLYDPTKALSSTYKKRAAKELGEDETQITAHLQSFRRWLDSMPHLKCPRGELVRFLLFITSEILKPLWVDAHKSVLRICQMMNFCWHSCGKPNTTTWRHNDVWTTFAPSEPPPLRATHRFSRTRQRDVPSGKTSLRWSKWHFISSL